MLNILEFESVGSTSSVLREMSGTCHGTLVSAVEQTAGRGQRGNSWEAEEGKNLTFSLLLEPCGVAAREQFCISEAVSVAIVDVLRGLVECPGEICIKWPNDIYWRDEKLCGILIENTLSGSGIVRSIAGVGINVNQDRFVSDAPNPVSLKMITGCEHALAPLLEHVGEGILREVGAIATPGGRESVSSRYRSMLWRRDGWHLYREPGGDAFEAKIVEIEPGGMLVLECRGGERRRYAFKEVAAVI